MRFKKLRVSVGIASIIFILIVTNIIILGLIYHYDTSPDKIPPQQAIATITENRRVDSPQTIILEEDVKTEPEPEVQKVTSRYKPVVTSSYEPVVTTTTTEPAPEPVIVQTRRTRAS